MTRTRSLATVLGFTLAALVGLVSACGSSTSNITPTSARAGLERAYSTLFNFGNKSVSAKTAVIENGSSLTKALTEALSSSLANSAAGARVDTVALLSESACSQVSLASPCAKVTYDLLGRNGSPLFPTSSTGYGVYVNGRWLVAKSTICALLGLFYSASGRSGTPPGC
jgi:hypothetical protein